MVTDSANVIRLEPDVKRHVRTRLARLPAQVHALHDIGQKALAGLLLRYFDAADDALFDLADKATSNAEQNSYFDAMRELRMQRKSIERSLFDATDELFARLVALDDRDQYTRNGELSADALSLVGNDDLEQMVALEATIGRASSVQAANARPLLQALCTLSGKEVTPEHYPFGVHVLCHAAMAEFKHLEIDIKAKLALFTLFERLVINQLDVVNKALGEYLCGEGIKVDFSASPIVAEAPASIPLEAGRRELINLLSFVQRLPLGPSGPHGYDIDRVLQAVQQRRGGTQLSLSRLEQETLSLVQMLFRFILQGQEMAAPMQQLMCRLQVPVVKVALLDADFLLDKKHPARRLLNQFASLATQWQMGAADEHSQSVHSLLHSSVERILARFETNVSIFSEVLADFSAVVEGNKRAAAMQEKRTVDAEDGKAKAAEARQRVAAEIAAQTQDKNVPSVVLALIRGPWGNALFVTGLTYGFGSSEWSAQLKVLSDLVASVQPCRDEAQRRVRVGMMPGLLRRLRTGLDVVSYNPFEVEALFAELEAIQLACIRGERLLDAHRPAADAAQSLAPAEKPVEPAPAKTSVEPKKPLSAELPADDPHLIAVATFSQGAWFDLTDDKGQTQRSRLAAYIKPTDKYIFVDRNGVKVAEQTRHQLALALKQGRLSPLDNNMLFDRALESVVSSLRKTHPAMPLDEKDS